jgi:hypothetical protein
MKLVIFFVHFEDFLLKSLDQTWYVLFRSRIVCNYLQNLAYSQLVNLLAGPKHGFRTVKTDAVKVSVRFNLVAQL